MNIDTTQTRIGVMILSTTITKAIADELRLYDIDYVTMSINVDQTVCASPACPAAHGHQKRNRICSKTNGGFWTCHCQNLSEIHKSRVTNHSEQTAWIQGQRDLIAMVPSQSCVPRLSNPT